MASAGRDSPVAIHVRITGRVQGVWFRAWTAENANRLHLDGYVRNRRDGSVEAVFKGAVAAVNEMLALCQRGPPAAVVHEVFENPWEEVIDPGFRQLPTV